MKENHEKPWLHHDYADWVSFIRYSLLGQLIRDDWLTISIAEFLNRASFMSRYPLAFFVCLKHDEENIFYLTAETVADPFFKKEFFNKIVDILPLKKTNAIKKVRFFRGNDLTDRHLIRIGFTQYYILIFRPKLCKYSPSLSPTSVNYILLGPDDQVPGGSIFDFFREIFDPSTISGLSGIGLQKHVTTSFKRFYKANKLVRTDNSAITVPIYDRDIVQDAFSDLTAIVSKHYDRLARSPLLSPNGRNLANFLVTAKVFDRPIDANRYSSYHYTPRLVLPENQLTDIEQAINDFPDKKIDFLTPYRRQTCYISFESIRDRMVEYLRRMGTPCADSEAQSGLRYCTDVCLTNGMSHVTGHPFSRCDLVWTEPSYIYRHIRVNLEKTSFDKIGGVEEEIDCFEAYHDAHHFAATLHYLMQIIGPDITGSYSTKCRSFMTMPLRTSGTAHLCATYVRKDFLLHTEGDERELVDDDGFSTSYLVYHELARDFERRIGHSLQQKYLETLSLIIAEGYAGCLKMIVNEYDSVANILSQYLSLLNEKTSDLCRVYPFPRPKFLHNRLENHCDTLHRMAPFMFTMESNPYFDQLSMGRKLVDADDIKACVERPLSQCIFGVYSNMSVDQRNALSKAFGNDLHSLEV